MEIGANPVLPNREGLTAYDYADDSKKQIEISLATTKNKIGGRGFSIEKTHMKLDNLNSIMRTIAESQGDTNW